MLQCASIYTYEIDDPQIAFEEIEAQLKEKITLLEHSIGIVLCHPEFISSGTLQYISKRLPFELVGMTSAAQAVNDEAGELLFTLFVMTSDDVMFKAGVTEDVSEDIDGPIKTAFGKITAKVPDLPKLAIIFPPLLLQYAGDAYVHVLQQIIPGTPIFGGVANDDTVALEGCETIYNGKNYTNTMAFILCYGNIQPRFFVGTFSEDRVMPYKGEVTKSNGPFVHEINEISAYTYFENIGLVRPDDPAFGEANVFFVPFVIHQKKRKDYDGIPVIRARASLMKDGAAIFLGEVDEGSTFTMLISDADDILSTTLQTIVQLNELSNVNGALMLSCIARRLMTMSLSPRAELEAVRNTVDPEIPFMVGYANGEICPTSMRNGIPVNRYHNFSLIILVI